MKKLNFKIISALGDQVEFNLNTSALSDDVHRQHLPRVRGHHRPLLGRRRRRDLQARRFRLLFRRPEARLPQETFSRVTRNNS